MIMVSICNVNQIVVAMHVKNVFYCMLLSTLDKGCGNSRMLSAMFVWNDLVLEKKMIMWKVYRQIYNVSLKNTLVILLARSIVDRLYVLKYICTYITSTLTPIFGNYRYVHLN